ALLFAALPTNNPSPERALRPNRVVSSFDTQRGRLPKADVRQGNSPSHRRRMLQRMGCARLFPNAGNERTISLEMILSSSPASGPSRLRSSRCLRPYLQNTPLCPESIGAGTSGIGLIRGAALQSYRFPSCSLLPL